MRKLFTLIVAVLTCTAVANAEQTEQKTVLKLLDFFGEPICTPYVVDISYENGVYTINNFADSGVPLSFMYTDSFETIMTGESFYSIDLDNPECDEYGLRNPESEENAILVLSNYMDLGETVHIYDPIFTKSTCLVFEDETGPYLSGLISGYEDLEDPNSLVFLEMQMYFKVFEGNSVKMTNINDSTAEYYNLQGQRVNNPVKGIFIRITNGKATKVAL